MCHRWRFNQSLSYPSYATSHLITVTRHNTREVFGDRLLLRVKLCLSPSTTLAKGYLNTQKKPGRAHRVLDGCGFRLVVHAQMIRSDYG